MRTRRVIALLLATVFLVAAPASGQESDPVVRGVLFFSPSCGHCEYVIQEVLPPLYDEHGGPWDLHFDETLANPAFYVLTNGTLELLLVDVTVQEGANLFQAATEALSIASGGVPRLIVSNQVMIGSSDIPRRFPDLIDQGLAEGGIDWPALPRLDVILQSVPMPTTTTTTSAETTTTDPGNSTTVPATTPTLPNAGDSVADRFGRDPLANSMAVIVLIGLLVSLVAAVGSGLRGQRESAAGYLVPILALTGLVIAGYLAYVEVGGVEATCGPVGDCNTVQQSEYARIFGIPIGVIGVVAYAGIALLWLFQRSVNGRLADFARIGLLAMTAGGVAFSVYLTFLEPFVIGATCMWCLGSAVVIGALLWASAGPGISSWRRLRTQ